MRVIRACRELGLGTVAVYSDCDRDGAARAARRRGASHRRRARRPRAICDIDRHRRRRAAQSGATLVHPGLRLPRRERGLRAGVRRRRPDVRRADARRRSRSMGSKTAAREAAIARRRAGRARHRGAVRRGRAGRDDRRRGASASAIRCVVKAVAGGGGKGMRTVAAPRRSAGRRPHRAVGGAARRSATPPSTSSAGSSARATSRSSCWATRTAPCAVRRARVLDPAAAPEGRRGVAVARARRRRRATRWPSAPRASRATVGYTNAGTIEFLLDRGRPVLLPRDEHAPAGRASGHRDGDGRRSRALAAADRAGRAADRSPPEQALTPRAHAIECRIYAEDPDLGFMPSPGLVRALSVPGGPGIRDDRGVAPGFEIPVFYDSMIAKLVVVGRHAAGRDRAARAARSTSTASSA